MFTESVLLYRYFVIREVPDILNETQTLNNSLLEFSILFAT